MANILVIDDDARIRSLIFEYAKDIHHPVAGAETLAEGLELAEYKDFDLLILDVRLPDGNGLDALPKFRQLESDPEVIIITGVGDTEGATLAINSGAWDYIQKPFSKQEILLQITRALQFRDKKTSARPVSLKREKIIGNSRQLSACLDQVAQSAATDANVLLTGETGTGKELFAQTIYENSSRAEEPFIVVDCAALPENLIESVLFGHRKGAFTGADKDHTGLVAQADRGTLFLDEIGELPLPIQKSFLRLLQERKFRPVGSTREITSNFRLISGTNKNLDELVENNTFRKDLLFRLRTFHLELPPLRERTGDIKELFLHYISQLCEIHRLQVKGYTPEFLDYLNSYDWPGNVREFIHTLEKAVLSDPGNPTLYPFHLPPQLRIHYAQTAAALKTGTAVSDKDEVRQSKNDKQPDFSSYLSANPPMKDFREKVTNESEKQYLIHILSLARQDTKAAREMSGLSESRFYTLLRKHGIQTRPK